MQILKYNEFIAQQYLSESFDFDDLTLTEGVLIDKIKALAAQALEDIKKKKDHLQETNQIIKLMSHVNLKRASDRKLLASEVIPALMDENIQTVIQGIKDLLDLL